MAEGSENVVGITVPVPTVSAAMPANPEFRAKLEKQIVSDLKFQRYWQRFCMYAYSFSTIITLLCSTGATLTAALGEATIAAFLAGTATVALGIEKSLLFREKWKLHLSIATRLEALLLLTQSGLACEAEALRERSAALGAYAERLPMGSREDA